MNGFKARPRNQPQMVPRRILRSHKIRALAVNQMPRTLLGNTQSLIPKPPPLHPLEQHLLIRGIAPSAPVSEKIEQRARRWKPSGHARNPAD
jgi:hypothetical protein